jgi:hypothetical protein
MTDIPPPPPMPMTDEEDVLPLPPGYEDGIEITEEDIWNRLYFNHFRKRRKSESLMEWIQMHPPHEFEKQHNLQDLIAMQDEETDEEQEPVVDANGEEKQILRQYCVLPEQLNNPNNVKLLHLAPSVDFGPQLIQEYEARVKLVQQQKLKFGHVIPVGKPLQRKLMHYQLLATLDVLFTLHSLYRKDLLDTQTGKVAMFPVCLNARFPAVVIHTTNFRKQIDRMYSALRHIQMNIHKSFQSVTYDIPNNLKALTSLTGFEHSNKKSAEEGRGWIAIPAEIVGIMKPYFVRENGELRPIQELLYKFYNHLPIARNRFVPQFQCIYLGEQRQVTVATTINNPLKKHNITMVRARAAGKTFVRGKTRKFTKKKKSHEMVENQTWELAPKNGVKYSELSYAFGLECWTEQLEALNYAYTFFTGQVPDTTKHMQGWFTLIDGVAKTRAESLAQGLFNDQEREGVGNSIRKERYNTKKSIKIDGREIKSHELFGKSCIKTIYRQKPLKSKKRKRS